MTISPGCASRTPGPAGMSRSCSTTSRRCTSRPSTRTGCARSATPRNAGSTRRSWSACSSTGRASPWRSAASRGTRRRSSRSCRSSGSSRPGTGIEGVVVVADAGMLSAANLDDLDDAGSGSSSARGSPRPRSTWSRTSAGTATRSPTGRSSTPSPRRPARTADNDPALRAEPAWDRQDHPKSWRAVWAFSAKRFARDNRTLTAQENRARDVISGAKTARTPRFVKNARRDPGPGREGPGPREKAGRAEGLRHQPPRHRHARRPRSSAATTTCGTWSSRSA